MNFFADAMLGEMAALQAALQGMNLRSFENAVSMLANTPHAIFMLGAGKSAQVADRLAASFRSVGIESWGVTAESVAHGNLGVIANTAVLVISRSGETDEVNGVLKRLREERDCVVIAIAPLGSTTADIADILLPLKVEEGLMPLASITAQNALGNTLIATVMAARGIDETAIVANHPGGAIGTGLR